MKPGIYILKKNHKFEWYYNINAKVLYPGIKVFEPNPINCLPVCVLSDEICLLKNKMGIKIFAFKDIFTIETPYIKQFSEDWELVEV